MPKGQIIKVLAGFYYVKDGNQYIQCRARGRFRNEDVKPLAGDYCDYELRENNDGYVMELYPRINSLIRPPICNIDQALLVFSRKDPDFSTLLLDKFLLIYGQLQVKPIICISKMDMQSDDGIEGYIEEYRKAGYTVIPISSKEKQGIEEIKAIFKDKITVITGQSGVGKSSLINALDASLNLQTNEISKSLGRGKHTTRHVELIEMFGGFVADTPGFSSFEIDMELVEAAKAYPDFEKYSEECKFRGCLHESEPSCRVKQAVEDGDISKERYQHYLQYIQLIKKAKERQYG